LAIQAALRDLPRNRNAGLSVLEEERIRAKCMNEHLTLDWDNLEDDDQDDKKGAPIPFSKELALKLSLDPETRPFFDAFSYAANQVGQNLQTDKEDAAKN
jgi:hypothetical protein